MSPSTLDEIRRVAARNGLDAVGVAAAEVFESTLSDEDLAMLELIHPGCV